MFILSVCAPTYNIYNLVHVPYTYLEFIAGHYASGLGIHLQNLLNNAIARGEATNKVFL